MEQVYNNSNLDGESKNKLINILKASGYTDIIDTDVKSIYTHWDVEATKDNKKYLFECKARNFHHNKYGDNCIELAKYNYINKEIEAGQADKGFVISFFTDDYVAINNIYDEHEINTRYAPLTTSFANRNKVCKTFCDYKKPIFKKIPTHLQCYLEIT